MPPPIITFTTDFGTGSPYVGQMKGAALCINSHATIVDITHSVPPQNIRHAALVLSDATSCFPSGTIHVAVVDPGVGTSRKILLAEIDGQRYIAPDNGLLSLVAQRNAPAQLIELTNKAYWRDTISSTFHGRDIMAPAAAHLSLGVAPDQLGPPATGMIELAWPQPNVAAGRIQGEVIAADSFGNLITNITGEMLPARQDRRAARISFAQRTIQGISTAYAEHSPGETVALVGSSNRLEVAVVNANAAAILTAGVGAPIEIMW